jgi:tRNA pseudouridine38-40 synthase
VKSRYFIFLSYKGTSYHGWQIQPNAVTVQEILDKALSMVLGETISTIGAGRTDTGVHASYFCAHFESERTDLDEDQGILFRLNRYLPEDIAISRIRRVVPDASARYSAISRTYKYFIARHKDPFTTGSSWYLHGHMDLNAMNETCSILFRHKDFTSFSRLHSGSKTNICTIYEAEWKEQDEGLVFTIRADRFLRNMVRALVGTMVDAGFGKLTPAEFERIILAMDRGKARTSAPGKGLFLTFIEYPAEIFDMSPNSR